MSYDKRCLEFFLNNPRTKWATHYIACGNTSYQDYRSLSLLLNNVVISKKEFTRIARYIYGY